MGLTYLVQLGWFKYWNHLDPFSLRHLTSTAPIWIHEKKVLMNFSSCKALLTPYFNVPNEWIRMIGWPFKFKTKFEFEWATNLSALTLSSFNIPFITRENISHEITHTKIKPRPPLLTPLVDRDKLVSIWIQNLIWIQWCNYSSLSSHVDKTFDIVLKGGEEWSVCKKNFKEKI